MNELKGADASEDDDRDDDNDDDQCLTPLIVNKISVVLWTYPGVKAFLLLLLLKKE